MRIIRQMAFSAVVALLAGSASAYSPSTSPRAKARAVVVCRVPGRASSHSPPGEAQPTRNPFNPFNQRAPQQQQQSPWQQQQQQQSPWQQQQQQRSPWQQQQQQSPWQQQQQQSPWQQQQGRQLSVREQIRAQQRQALNPSQQYNPQEWQTPQHAQNADGVSQVLSDFVNSGIAAASLTLQVVL
jgi:hypothetical protein